MDTNVLKRFAQEARIGLQNKVRTKIDLVLHEESAARRESPKAVRDLESKIRSTSKEKVIEQVAYTWFNRFTALQYMDMNGYNRVRVIAPSEGQTRPEILSEASAGSFEDALISENIQNIVRSLLDGHSASSDPDNEAYRYLIVSVCNAWHSTMPFLFERIADYTELLMPDDLLSSTSILVQLREAMTEENCQDVEVIGWLYQFYISEKKEEVFEGLKKNQKVTPENIPAATQLFTPNWIVRYLVENSLGRLWMLNHPNSSLVKEMEYYIAPDEPETDFLKITSPEEIKVCDPACGSGHMLTYSFDLLYKIYEEAGYDVMTIPTLILQNNLYGIELDQRAGELSAFALTMKARGKHRRFFRNPIQPNICVLENIKFDADELNEYMERVGRDLFTFPFRTTLTQFEESDNFGSLIQPALEDVDGIRETLRSKDLSGNLFLKSTHDRVLQVLHQADYLRQKYHVVVANPPYMGGKGMNGRLSVFAKDKFPDSKSDLFAMFMERTLRMTVKSGMMAMINMQSWMFLSSYEKLRSKLLSNSTVLTMAHIGPRGFDTIGGEVVSTTACIFQNNRNPDHKGNFLRLIDGMSEAAKSAMTKEAISNPDCGWSYRVPSKDFQKIPGSPIAYWVSKQIKDNFSEGSPLKTIGDTRQGMATSDNDRFLRSWWEIDISRFMKNAVSNEMAVASSRKWFPYNKGGNFRKWYGNIEHVVNWENGGTELLNYASSLYGSPTRTIKSISEYFKPSISWSKISSGNLAMRYYKTGFIFDVAGCCIFTDEENTRMKLLGYTNSKVVRELLTTISPTLNFETGHIASLPILLGFEDVSCSTVLQMIKKSNGDWDSYETSWDFTSLLLLSSNYRSETLQNTYHALRNHWQGMTDEMLRLEEENNRIFIDAYGLQDELTPDVPLHEITLTCNPAYRYGQKVSEDVREERLQQDTIKEFISYAVGCMFGRYALEEPGLILANAGETIKDFLQKVPNPSFPADDDNIIPILDEDWFDDDITERFRKFLRVTFGEEHFIENLRFIETSIGKPIRNYFLRDFYKNHVQTYKKRPIYWQFSSPKGSFNALIYMHRYNRDTVSVMLDQYLRQFKVKLTSQKTALERTEVSSDSSQGEKTKAITQIQKVNSILQELETWERDVIFPLASQRIEIDLDDGVKTNYPKFKTALTKIPGLS